MSELGFRGYQSDAFRTAYYLDEPLPSQHEGIYLGFNEEVNELLSDDTYSEELTALLWGRAVPPEIKEQLEASKKSEVGDVLYYVAAASSLRDIRLGSVATEAVRLFTGGATDTTESFSELDMHVKGKMTPSVSATYKPDYFGMQFFNLPPFEDVTSGELGKLQEIKGPLTLFADGRYSLERITRTFSEQLGAFGNSKEEDFVTSAGLTLGALSIIAQDRLDTTLEQAAVSNMAKRQKRLETHALKEGWDTERSRAVGTLRPKLHSFENTQANLLSKAVSSNR